MHEFYLICFLVVVCHVGQSFLIDGRSLKHRINSRDSTAAEDDTQHVKKWIQGTMTQQQRQVADKRAPTSLASATQRQVLSAILVNSTSNVECIGGVAIRNNKLYVGRFGLPLEVYDSTTLSYERRIDIAGLECIFDVASCADCDVIYIADQCRNMIHVIGDDGGLRAQWNVSDTPVGLSVNQQSNVIVTIYNIRKLFEFNSDGQLVREVALQSDTVMDPLHAVQLNDDRYVVAHTDWATFRTHRVCIVNGDGAVVHCYGGLGGSGVGQLYYPIHLVVSGHSLIVSDNMNQRLLLLDLPPLTFVRELVNMASEEYNPEKLALNEDGTRLYVASGGNALLNGCGFKVFDLVED